MKTNISGFSPIAVTLVLTGIILTAGGAFYWQKQQISKKNQTVGMQASTNPINQQTISKQSIPQLIIVGQKSKDISTSTLTIQKTNNTERKISKSISATSTKITLKSGILNQGAYRGRKENIFPTTENKIIDGTATATVTTEEGFQMQVIGGQLMAEFYDTATHADYINLEAFIKKRGAQIIGQIPDLYMVQIGVTSDDKIMPLVIDLKKLPYIEDSYPNMVVSSAAN